MKEVYHSFKKNTKRRRQDRCTHKTPVCNVIICNVTTGSITRKPFLSWDAARAYVNEREASRKYRVSIEPI